VEKSPIAKTKRFTIQSNRWGNGSAPGIDKCCVKKELAKQKREKAGLKRFGFRTIGKSLKKRGKE